MIEFSGGEGHHQRHGGFKSILELLVETLNQLWEVGSVSTAIDEYVREAVE